MEDFVRGSEWRRWDLHLHTPGTLRNNNFTGKTLDEKWANFYATINNYIDDGSNPLKTVAVIGVTDYLSLDCYRKVVSDNKLPAAVKLVLPNIEMRMLPTANNSPINIHFIFNPKVVSEIETRFFSKLKFQCGDTSYSASKAELRRLGRTFDSALSDEEAYKKGAEQFVPPLVAFQNVFNQDRNLRENVIIAVSNKSSDGASGDCLRNGQFATVRNAIYRFVDVIFSGDPADTKYFLGDGVDDLKTIIEKYGTPKPCVHGSDAHDDEHIFEPDFKRYCWIKADPTFNGLRQILYEPKERVCISETVPEEKQDYYVIDSIRFSNSKFQATPIYFNNQLNCIIGGKSTGKSILLHNLARSIDMEQVNNKNQIVGFNTWELNEIETTWRDGSISKPNDSETHKIVYIPQAYLNRLSDESEESTEIDNIIQDIVLLNEEANSAYLLQNKSIKNQKPIIDKAIYDLVELHKQWDSIESEKSELGSSKGIKSEIEKMTTQKEKLSKETSLTKEELDKYEAAITQIAKSAKAVVLVQKNINLVNDIKNLVAPIALDDDIADSVVAVIEKTRSKALEAANKVWTEDKPKILSRLNSLEKEEAEKKKQSETIRESLKSKIEGNEAITKLTKNIASETQKLELFDELQKKQDAVASQEKKIINQISTLVIGYQSFHKTFADTINESKSISSEGLEFSVKTPFRKDVFIDSLSDIFDKRSFKSIMGASIEDIDMSDINSEWFSKIYLNILSGNLSIKKKYNSESALRELSKDWFNSTYDVEMDNDTIDTMSPGKKALVLLKLLISLAESHCPILIDQPEDDLDNRSIFEDLINFIKSKKKERQIIVATHNANIVLGSDAEEVIVANQDGANTPNEQYQFEYRSGSIENDRQILDSQNQPIDGVLNHCGIQEHICDILEGGKQAFDLRRHKYNMLKE